MNNISVRANQRQQEAGSFWEGVSFHGMVLMLLLATATAMGCAYCNIKSTNISYKVSQAKLLKLELKEVAHRLTVELNHLRDPARLEREGARLGLSAPASDRMRRLP